MEPNGMEAEGVLAAFLLDMEDLDHAIGLEDVMVKSESLAVCAHALQIDTLSGTNSANEKRPTRKRVGRHLQILALQQELDALTRQRESLNQERLLREEIARQERAGACPRAVAHWKRQAQSHEITKQCSQQKQEHLVQCLKQNAQRLEIIKEALSEQMNGLRVANPPLQLQISDSNENDVYAYRMLKETLNAQHAQVDAFLAQCAPAFDPARHYESSIHADGAGIDVRSFVISPFHIALINDAIQRYTQDRHTRVSLGGSVDGDAYFQRLMLPPVAKKGCGRSPGSMHGRSLLRRVVREQFIVVVWATVVDWQDEQTQRPTICKNGWCVIKPSAEYGPSASFTQSLESTYIYQADGSSRFPIDRDTRRVLNSIESYARGQAQIVENLILDASLAWERSSWKRDGNI